MEQAYKFPHLIPYINILNIDLLNILKPYIGLERTILGHGIEKFDASAVLTTLLYDRDV